MSKLRYQTEKSKYWRKSSNESIYKLSATLPSTFSKFVEMQELRLNETLHCTLRQGPGHNVGYFSKPLCGKHGNVSEKKKNKQTNKNKTKQKTNGCQYHVQMKPYSVLGSCKLQAAKWDETRSHTNSTGQMPPQGKEPITVLPQRQPQGNLHMTNDSCSVKCARILLVCLRILHRHRNVTNTLVIWC